MIAVTIANIYFIGAVFSMLWFFVRTLEHAEAEPFSSALWSIISGLLWPLTIPWDIWDRYYGGGE